MIITYNKDMNKNRGMDMEEDKDIELKEIREILKRLEEKENEKTRVHLKMYKNIWRDVALVFLIIIGATIAVTIWQVKINKERYEASERARSERASEFTREANERASEREKDLEKQREDFRKDFGKEPSF